MTVEADILLCPHCKSTLELETEQEDGRETWKCSLCFIRVYEKVAEAECVGILVPCKGCKVATVLEDADSPYCELCEDFERKIENEHLPYVN